MSNDQDLSVFSDRKNIQQIYEERGCPEEFEHENFLYECRKTVSS